jgi:hypothetical protein
VVEEDEGDLIGVEESFEVAGVGGDVHRSMSLPPGQAWTEEKKKKARLVGLSSFIKGVTLC